MDDKMSAGWFQYKGMCVAMLHAQRCGMKMSVEV
jgi:hypothetical protein